MACVIVCASVRLYSAVVEHETPLNAANTQKIVGQGD
jgi:hypothetical protein